MNNSHEKSRFPRENHLHHHQVPWAPDHPEENHGAQRKDHSVVLSRLFQAFCQAGFCLVQQLIFHIPRILAELHIYDLFEEMKVFTNRNPFIAVILACMALACGIPVLIFVAFAAITIFLTFGGFIIIEGTVLAAGSFALLLCLATLAGVFITISFLGGLLYLTFMQIARIVQTNSVSHDSTSSFNSRIPEVLASLRKLPHANTYLRHNLDRRSNVSSSNSANGHVHLQHLKQASAT